MRWKMTKKFFQNIFQIVEISTSKQSKISHKISSFDKNFHHFFDYRLVGISNFVQYPVNHLYFSIFTIL